MAGDPQQHHQHRLHGCSRRNPEDYGKSKYRPLDFLRKYLEEPLIPQHCAVHSRIGYAKLSLNATIALVITAAKSTALLSVAACISQWKWVYFSARPRRLEHMDLIEEASRGPYGSLGMIVRIPWSMATLGAIVTVVALGIDTFAQQVISQDSTITWVDDGAASFGLARDYYTNATNGISNLGSAFTYSRKCSLRGSLGVPPGPQSS